MAFKLLDMAQRRWRRLDGANLLPLVRAGEKFITELASNRSALLLTQLTINRGRPPERASPIHNIW